MLSRKEFILIIVVAVLLLLLGLFVFPRGEAEEQTPARPAYVLQVIDGDTVWVGLVTKVRISNIDTPETYRPRCPEEKELGMQATDMARHLMPKGSLVFLRDYKEGKDKYRRILARVVTSDGQDMGEVLIAHGLAKPWKGKRHKWCEELRKKEEDKGEENKEKELARAFALDGSTILGATTGGLVP